MRLFIAINFPKDCLNKIEQISSFFKKKTPSAALKWVQTDHLHLTLKFIGEVEESKVDPIREILIKSVDHQIPFDIEVGDLGMYPHKNNPRVIWLGISGGEPLILMQKKLDLNLASLGIKRESHPFSPHLTIARVRRDANPSAVRSIGETLSQFTVEPLGAVTIDRVQLNQSDLKPTGPIYTTLFSVLLNQV